MMKLKRKGVLKDQTKLEEERLMEEEEDSGGVEQRLK
jgi:hypothetical protein